MPTLTDAAEAEVAAYSVTTRAAAMAAYDAVWHAARGVRCPPQPPLDYDTAAKAALAAYTLTLKGYRP